MRSLPGGEGGRSGGRRKSFCKQRERSRKARAIQRGRWTLTCPSAPQTGGSLLSGASSLWSLQGPAKSWGYYPCFSEGAGRDCVAHSAEVRANEQERRVEISPQVCFPTLSRSPLPLPPSMALLGTAGTEEMELERCRGQIAKAFARCAVEFGLFPVGSGKPAEVFKWILILLPMGDGWEKCGVGLRPGTVPSVLPARLSPCSLQGQLFREAAPLEQSGTGAFTYFCVCLFA